MTWITRISHLEGADDLDIELASSTLVRSARLWNTVVFEGVEAANPWHRMWDGYEAALAGYVAALGISLVQRGVSTFRVVDSVVHTLVDLRKEGYEYEYSAPPWSQDADVIRSHRSNLIRRYGSRVSFKGTPLNMPMLWPFVDREGGYALMLSKHDKSLIASGERKLPHTIAKRVENL